MSQIATLSKREKQIAAMIAWGGAKKEIADQLFISVRTVETTSRTIYKKIGITKSTELSVWYFCTHFNISFDLSPLKRQIIAISLLLIFLPFEFSQQKEMIRSTRARITEERIVESRRAGREDYLKTCIA